MSDLAERIDARLHDSSSPQRTAIIDEVISLYASPPDLPATVSLDLLRRFMAHVISEEGVAFCDVSRPRESFAFSFTDEEASLLNRIGCELDAPDARHGH